MTKPTDASLLSDDTSSAPEQMAALYSLRASYRESHGLFSPREMAHLRFIRWLVQNGTLRSDQHDGESDGPLPSPHPKRRSR
jgi:hypothetical protein